MTTAHRLVSSSKGDFVIPAHQSFKGLDRLGKKYGASAED